MRAHRGIGLSIVLGCGAIAVLALAVLMGCERTATRVNTAGSNASLVGAGSTFSSVLFKNWFAK